MDTLTFYVVRSKDGKYLRSTGIGGGAHWIEDIKKAKVWNKIGTAKAQVTFWASNYPEFGVPEIIPFLATPQEPMNLEDHVNNSIRKKELDKLNHERWRAEEKLAVANVELSRYTSGWRNEKAKEEVENITKKLNDINTNIKKLKHK